MPVIKYKNRCIKFKNKVADVRNRFELTLEQTNGGLLSSNKLSGWWNDEVTLYNTPSAHYDFNGYSITGSTLYDNNKFKFNGSCVSAEAIFTPWPVRNVSLVQTSGGTITASPMTGYDGDTVILSNTADSGLTLSAYELTGATLLDTNKFIWNGSDVIAKAKFYNKYNPLNLEPGWIRVRTNDGQEPRRGWGTHYSTAVKVQGTTNEYDCYQNGNTFYAMFSNSTNITDVLGANASIITNFAECFRGCSSLSSVNLFDTSNGTAVYYMFDGCTNLLSVPDFNFSNANSVDSMFQGCTNLITVGNLDISNVKSCTSMFENCVSLENIQSLKTTNVVNMERMFWNSNISHLPDLDTHNVSSFCGMFSNCNNMIDPIILDTSNGINLGSMYSQCTNLTSVPLLNTDKAQSVDYMFYLDRNVCSGISALYQQMSTQTNPPTAYSYCFENCGTNNSSGIAEWLTIPDDWK